MSTAVYFFGGFNASQDDIDAWVKDAQRQKPHVTFSGFPWESGPDSWPAETVVKGSKKKGTKKIDQFTSAVDAIKACGADKIYIVGHSSGCAVSNAVDKEITKGLKDPSKFVLVTLDGFSPDDDQLKRENTQVWGADCGDPKSKDYVTSKNFPGLSKGRRKIHHTTNCTKLWPLHFSLVNDSANNDTVHGISTGYFKCKANLEWLSPT